MIAVLHNKIDSVGFSLYSLDFYYEEEGGNRQAEISLGGVIFEDPYTVEDMEARVQAVFPVLFPEQTLNQIIIE